MDYMDYMDYMDHMDAVDAVDAATDPPFVDVKLDNRVCEGAG